MIWRCWPSVCAGWILAATCWAQPGGQPLSRKVGVQGDGRIESPIPFRAAGVYWQRNRPEDGERTIRIRASKDGATWTEWIAVHAEDELPGRFGSGLVHFGDLFRYMELDTEGGNPEGVEVLFIDPGLSKRREFVPMRESAAAPAVVPREQWGCTPQACPVRSPPVYTQVTHMVVHHSAGTNVSEDWASVVRAIWVLHVEGNGWNDIGYNYLIDPHGVVYEGRAGGDGVLGAHFSGVNSGTIGLCLLGTFSSQRPPAATLATLEHVLAWQAGKWKIDAGGHGLHASSQLWLNHISGHRDAGLSPRATSRTECPGNGLYVALPEVRARARAIVEGACRPTITGLPRCLPPASSEVPFAFSMAPGCQRTAESPVGWLRVEVGEGTESRLRVDLNPGETRSGSVRVGGRTFHVQQAAAGGWPAPCMAQEGIVDAAGTDRRPVVAQSLFTIFGSNLAAGTSHAGQATLPSELGGTTVAVNGRPVPLLFVSPNQINAQLPAGVAIGTATLAVTAGGVTGPEANFWVTEAAPAVFAYSSNRAVAVNHEDGWLNGPETPVRPDAPLVVYLSGAGPVSGPVPAPGAPAQSAQSARLHHGAQIGGRAAEVLYLGLAPGLAGVYQCNLLVPMDLPAGDLELVITVAGAASRASLISVAGPQISK